MRELESTQLMPVLVWDDPRVHLLDDTWLLTICAVVLAIALPWFVSGLRIEFAATAAGLLVLGVLHLILAAMSSRRPTSQARETLGLSSLHALGVIAISFIWAHVGGLQNPLFLVAFALPVVGAIFLSRWQPYLMAALSALMVTLVACSEAPELRWYAPWLGAAGRWLDALFGGEGGASLPFAAFSAPSQYYVVLLEVFAIMVFACAVAAEYLANIFGRLDAQMWTARAEAARSQELWSTLVEQLPVPALLLDARTHEIVGASGAAVKRFLAGAEPIAGRDFFQAVHFSYPEPIERLIDGGDGVEPLSMVQLGAQLLATEIRVQHLAQHGRRFALVVVSDTTEDFCVKAALDVAEYAALVVDSQGRVLALNRPARALFAEASSGTAVSSLLPQANLAARWWDPGLSGRHKTHVTVMRRMYQVTTSAVALPGEEARLYVIAFLPMARLAAEDQSPTGSTTVLQWP